MMSELPSPLKSPILTSTQVTAVLQAVIREVVTLVPVLSDSHHWPLSRARPAMSVLPSPLKSPTTTSTQVTAVLQDVPNALEKALLPFESASHHWPDSAARPAMSWTRKFPARPLPLAVLPPTSVTVTVKTWVSAVAYV